jgi:DNA-directed RNA polymerase subunit RPC12/RpoP
MKNFNIQEINCPYCRSKDIKKIYEHLSFHLMHCQQCAKIFKINKESNS